MKKAWIWTWTFFSEQQNQKYSGNSLLDYFFGLMRHLLNQAMDMTSNNALLINIWSFMALILTCCLSGGILTSLMFKPLKNINSIDELVESNLTIVNYNESSIWYVYDNEKKYKMPLDNNLRRIKNNLEFFDRNLFYQDVYLIYCRNILINFWIFRNIWEIWWEESQIGNWSSYLISGPPIGESIWTLTSGSRLERPSTITTW